MAMPLTHRSYPKRWTAYDVRALMEASPTHWPRYEAIDGELIVTPAPRLAHQEMLEQLSDALKPYVARYGLGRVLRSPADLELEKDSIIQPDLFVVPASLAQAREWSDVTTLLLAIEVLSPSSRTRDRVIKRRFLQRVAVPEYWVVDLSRRLVERWRPDDRHAEMVASSLVWHPPGPNEPLTIDLVSLFAVVCG
ncbi:MAG TPA: Uma2 family endonuclease [Gemmatimonadaceae bacterium]